MERTAKIWGEKINLFINDLCEVSILTLKANKRCSWHKHQTKYNLFYVIDGRIWLQLEDGAVCVEKGQIFTTSPGEYHEFQTGEKPAVVMEIMYVQYNSQDIDRDKLGGAMDEPYIEE